MARLPRSLSSDPCGHAGRNKQSIYRWQKGERPAYDKMVSLAAATGIAVTEWSQP